MPTHPDPSAPDAERQALIALYDATDGPNWSRKDDWLSASPICTWRGVTCEGMHVTHLDLSYNVLRGSIPPEIGQLSNLQELDLPNNQLTNLPPEIGRLTNLQTLRLEWNHLTNLPPEIGQLTNLEVLDLSHNQLTSLPSEIDRLVNLRTLVLDDNQLTSLPPEIGQLSNLQVLGLEGNPLTALPPEVCQLRADIDVRDQPCP